MPVNSESVSKGWLKRPRRDIQKRNAYHENYRRTEKGAAILKEGKRRYWEKLKADPVRLDEQRAKVRAADRLRRLDPEKRAQENARWRERHPRQPRKPKKERAPKDRKPMKPLDVTVERKKNWVSARRQSLFVENAKTIKRGRPKKKKTERPHCDHNAGFVFLMTEVGMKRTCNACKRSFTEVAKR